MLCYFQSLFQEFLVQDEHKQVTECNVGKKIDLDSVVVDGDLWPSMIVLTGVSAKWILDGEISLTDLNTDIRAGQLVAVIGTVGCGKVTSKTLTDDQTDTFYCTFEIWDFFGHSPLLVSEDALGHKMIGVQYIFGDRY